MSKPKNPNYKRAIRYLSITGNLIKKEKELVKYYDVKLTELYRFLLNDKYRQLFGDKN